MRYLKAASLLIFAWTAAASLHPRSHQTHDYFALHLDPSASPSQVAVILGVTLEGPVGQLPDHYTFSAPKHTSDSVDEVLEELRRKRRRRRRSLDLSSSTLLKRRYPTDSLSVLDGILWSQKQTLKRRIVKRIPPAPVGAGQGPPEGEANKGDPKALARLDDIANKLDIRDPIFKEQWHLFNPVQLGHDLNVTGVWLRGYTGNGSITAVIDDGIDFESDDLRANYYAAGSFDFNDRGPDPLPRLFDDKHGTRCAGEIAAVRNDVCGVGMAYDGKVAGLRILSGPITDEDEAIAVNYDMQNIQVYSCSWGPPDDGKTMDTPGLLIQRAMVNGVQNGRGGLGSVYVLAAGNGGAAEDNCNFDGYANSIYTVTVGAIDRQGLSPYYSERCAAQLVVTYSSGSGDAIHTTDVGKDTCNIGHGGTSAAAPLAVGLFALALGVRPDLTWRDLQKLCMETAVPIHEEDEGWQTTSIGKKFSHSYGYGKLDAYAFVEAAQTFETLKPQAWWHSPWLAVKHEIPQGDQGLLSSFDVTEDMLKAANLESLEHVTVTMNVNHTRRGDLSVELQSPSGVISHLSRTRRGDAIAEGYVDWTFMSVAHWGESGQGTWTVVVKDTNVNENSGTFIDWRLNLWGECIDPSNQQLHPMPTEHDDDHETTAVPVATTSVQPLPEETASLPAKPSDHIDRPVNVKPSSTEAQPTPTASPTPTATQSVSDSFLPSFFPTFGVSKRTQIWIYGALGLIVVFCAALGAYFIVQRRKRLRNNPRDDYEFEMLNDEDDTAGLNGHANGKRGKRRAGELYDAFAGESDEEVFSDPEEEDDGPYRDAPERIRGRTEKRAGSAESLHSS